MEDLSLHLLDVAENALAAGADHIEIRILEQSEDDVMRIEVGDNGCGMDEQTLERALDPFYTTKPDKRVGLGLPLFAQAAEEAGGHVEIQTFPGKSTKVCATFRLSHPDLKPLGDVFETMATLACAHPKAKLAFEHRRDGAVISRWDNREAV